MTGSLTHRGPDGLGIFVSESGRCVLGHRRLSILDLSNDASQPMRTQDAGNVIVYNGEIYNFRQLRERLSGMGESFRSSGDTEVLLRFLSRLGPSSLSDVNGMFALALWDEKEQQLTLARDRFGQKPLFYSIIDSHLIFASEVRALLKCGFVPKKLCREGVLSFLCYGAVQGPTSIIDRVKLFPQATASVFSLDLKCKTTEYWHPPESRQSSTDRLRDVFVESVQRHLISDVPVGLFLSGGIDSSAIASCARKCRDSIECYSVTFPDQPEYSEEKFSRQAAATAGCKRVEIPVSDSEASGMLHKALDSMDQPSCDGVNTYITSHAVRQHGLKVALSGLGGDELFGGYSSFCDVPKAANFRRLIPFSSIAASGIGKLGKHSKKLAKIQDILDAPADLISAYLIRRRVFSTRQIKSFISDCSNHEWISGVEQSRLEALQKCIKSRKPEDAVGILELNLYMGEMLLRDSDVMGMANGLEIRMPFLDTEFSDLALSLDTQVRRPTAVPKHAFVAAMGDWLDKDIYQRPKQGFTLPFEKWLQEGLREKVFDQLRSLSELIPIFNQDAVTSLWNNFCKMPEKVGWSRPWSLYVLGRYVAQHKMTF